MAYEGYYELQKVLDAALDQAAIGKGKERHANNKPIIEQPNQTISDTLNSPIGLIYQAHKKSQEALNLDHPKALKELLGAINYLAFAYIWMERHYDKPSAKHYGDGGRRR